MYRFLKKICSFLTAAAMSTTMCMGVAAEELREAEEQMPTDSAVVSVVLDEMAEAAAPENTDAGISLAAELQGKSEGDFMRYALDALSLYAYLSGEVPVDFPQEYSLILDADMDGDVTVSDAIIFLTYYARKCAGLSLPFDPSEVPTEIPGGVDVPPTTTEATTTTTTEATTTTTEATTTTTEATTTTTEATTTTTEATTTTTEATTTTTEATTTTTEATTTTTEATTTTTEATTTTTTEATTSTEETTSTTAITTVPIEFTTTETTEETLPYHNGIDVSEHQGYVNWQAVKDSGRADFVMVRAGYGQFASQEDRRFRENMAGAKAVGLPVGVYWFSYALTPEAAVREADACYEVIKDYQFEYPVVFDMESVPQMSLKPEEVTAIINAFCKQMESHGYYVTLYSYASFLNYKVENSILESYDVWVAHYDVPAPSFTGHYGMWQYACNGRVPGISTDVDLNYCYINYPAIMKRAGLNGF